MSTPDAIDPALLDDLRQYVAIVAETGKSPDFMSHVSDRDVAQAYSVHLGASAAYAAIRLADSFARSSPMKDMYLTTARLKIGSALDILCRNSRLAAFLHESLATASSCDDLAA